MITFRYHCTLVDMALRGWARALPYPQGADVWEKLPGGKRLAA